MRRSNAFKTRSRTPQFSEGQDTSVKRAIFGWLFFFFYIFSKEKICSDFPELVSEPYLPLSLESRNQRMFSWSWPLAPRVHTYTGTSDQKTLY